MLERQYSIDGVEAYGPQGASDRSDFIDIDAILAAVRRQALLVGACAAAALVLAFVYLWTAQPRYTASAQILLDDSANAVVDKPIMLSASPGDALIASQMELIQSEKIALAVVDALDLVNREPVVDPSLLTRAKMIVSTLKSWIPRPSFGGGETAAGAGGGEEDDPRRDAAGTLQSNVSVERAGRSMTFYISYTSEDPVLAKDVAAAYAAAYINYQRQANAESMEMSGAWLEKRIEELKSRATEADMAVQQYRKEKGLIASNGQLVSEQQLSQINSELVQAQADTAKAKAQYDQFRTLLDRGDPVEVISTPSVSDASAGSVLGDLRKRFVAGSQRLSEIKAQFGDQHPEAARLTQELEETKQQLLRELQSIAEGYANTYHVASMREQSLRDSLSRAMGESASSNETAVSLRRLEQDALAYQTLYRDFTEHYQEAIQKLNTPLSIARVIGEPSVPTAASAPRRSRILVLALALGLGAGAGIGMWREFREQGFRTGEQIPAALGLEFLGFVPLMPGESDPQPRRDRSEARIARFDMPLARYLRNNPYPLAAETFRNAILACQGADGAGRTRVIGVISALPGEGKTTTTANLARMLASQGSKTLLIDADIRNPGLTRELAGEVPEGLIEVVMQGIPVNRVCLLDKETKLVFIPVAPNRSVLHTSQFLASDAMKTFLQSAQRHFDVIVVDLPPMAPVIDARAFAGNVDAFILVAEWGTTPRRYLRSMMAAQGPAIRDKCVGVVLNKAELTRLELYQPYTTFKDYYQSASYGG
jgi:succinoglycan biosynthesis transport protein ExoP